MTKRDSPKKEIRARGLELTLGIGVMGKIGVTNVGPVGLMPWVKAKRGLKELPRLEKELGSHPEFTHHLRGIREV